MQPFFFSGIQGLKYDGVGRQQRKASFQRSTLALTLHRADCGTRHTVALGMFLRSAHKHLDTTGLVAKPSYYVVCSEEKGASWLRQEKEKEFGASAWAVITSHRTGLDRKTQGAAGDVAQTTME